MEAVPRMPMLFFDLKNCAESVDLASVLKTYIEDFYNEDPANYNKECQEIEQLRQNAVAVSRDFTGCSTLKKYYAQLLFLKSRFPMEEGEMLAIPFTWEEAYSGKRVSVSDIKYEEACILYNIGALHSLLGAMDTRQTPEGMKVSCTHFQCAVYAFTELRDRYPLHSSADFNYDLLTFYTSLMLAQAQECILEKSMKDNRKSSITAKIAAQVVDYYKQASQHLDSKEGATVVGTRKSKEWKRRIELKMSYHLSIMYLYLGNESQEKEKWGEAVIYLQTAQEKLNDSVKIAKTEDNQDIEAALTFTMDVVGGRYNSVKKDNSFVYHDKIPALESLPDIKGAALVKGIPFNPKDVEVSGPDIFQRLVPMAAHEASSLYSEEKAQLLRSVGAKIERKNQELEHFMDSLQIHVAKLFPVDEKRLPAELVEKCAQLSVKTTAIGDLKSAMQKLASVASDMDFSISQVFTLLEDEDKNEQQFQESFGKRGRNVTLDEIRKDAVKLKEGLDSASKSNVDLRQVMDKNVTNLTLLTGSLDELQAALPSVSQIQHSPEDSATMEEMKRLVGKVEEMKQQRMAWEAQLREQVHKDDVTSALVTQQAGSQEEFFKEQLRKHDSLIELLEKNMSAQDNILRALTEANAKYARVKKTITETELRREAMVQELMESCELLDELLGKTRQGVQFYQKLEGNINRVLERTLSVCKAQNEERDQIKARLKPKGPPPARPTAPKPGSAAPVDPAVLPSLNLNEYDLDPQIMGIASNRKVPSMTGGEKVVGPTLMDYLPYMKPKTFGDKEGKDGVSPLDKYATSSALSQIPGLNMNTGSLPTSQSVSPVHLPPHAASQPASPAHSTRNAAGLRGAPSPLAQNQVGAPQPAGYLAPAPATHAQQSDLGNRAQMPSNQMHVPNSTSQLPNNQKAMLSNQMHMPAGQPLNDQHLRNTQMPGNYPPLPNNQLDVKPGGPGMYTQPPPGGSQVNQTSSGHGVQGPYPATNQGPVVPSSATPPSEGAQQKQQFDASSIQSPTAPPGAPSGRGGYILQQQTNQVPGGPSAGNINPYQAPQPVSHQARPSASQQAPPTASDQYLPPASQQAAVPASQHLTLSANQPVILSASQQPLPSVSQQHPTSANQLLPQAGQLAMHPAHAQAPPPASQQPSLSAHQPPLSVTKAPPPSVNQHPQYDAAGQPALSANQQPQTPANQQAALSANQQPSVSVSQQSAIPQLLASQGQPYPPQGGDPITSQTAYMQFPSSAGQQYSLTAMHYSSQQGYVGGPDRAGSSAVVTSSAYLQTPGQGQNYAPQGDYSVHANVGQIPLHATTQTSTAAQRFPAQNQQNTAANQPSNAFTQQPSTYPKHEGQSGGAASQNPASNSQPGYVQYQHQGGFCNQTSAASLPPQHLLYPHAATSVVSSPHANQATSTQSTSGYNSLPSQSTQASQNGAPVRQQAGFPIQDSAPQSGYPGTPGSAYQAAGAQAQGRYTAPQNTHPTGASTSRVGAQVHQTSYPAAQGVPSQVPHYSQWQPQGQQGQPQVQMAHGQVGQGHCQVAQGYSQTAQGHMGHIHGRLPQGEVGQGHTVSSQGQPGQVCGQISQLTQGNVAQGQVSQTSQYPNQYASNSSQIRQPHVPAGTVPNQPSQVNVTYGAGRQPFISNAQTYSQYSKQACQSPGQFQNMGQQLRPAVQSQQPQRPFQAATGYPLQGQQQPPRTAAVSQQAPQQYAAYQAQPRSSQLPLQPVQGYSQVQGYQGQLQGQAGQAYTATGPSQQGGFQQSTAAVGQGHQGFTQQPQGQPGLVQGQYGYPQTQSGAGTPQTMSPQSTPRPTPTATPVPLSSTVIPPTPVLTPLSSDKLGAPQGQATFQPTPPLNVTQAPGLPVTSSQVPGAPANNFQSPATPAQPSSLPQPITLAPQESMSSATSLDDLLSSSPNASFSSVSKADVLTPKRITAEEIERKKEEERKTSVTHDHSDPYADSMKLSRFVQEVEAFSKQVESLSKQPVAGPSLLDKEWRELSEYQERECRGLSMAIARCYPMKNRYQDVMPYDATRVVLTSGNDDYINASHIGDLTPSCPKFIATQAPLAATSTDLWWMVYEQGTELIVMLNALEQEKMHLYWPKDKSHTMYHGPFQLNLTSVKQKANWTERIITLTQKETHQTRSLVHLQFHGWPLGGRPENVASLLQFIGEVHTFYTHQRSLMKPVVVHCSDGLGRTGAFCVIYTAIQEVIHGQGIVGIKDKVNGLRMRRKWMVREKCHLQFCYEAVLHYVRDFLIQRGIVLSSSAAAGEKRADQRPAHKPADDPLFGADLPLSAIQSTVARMTLKERQEPDGGEQTTSSSQGAVTLSDKLVPSVTAPSQLTSAQLGSCISSEDSVFPEDASNHSVTTSPKKANAERKSAEQPAQNVMTSSIGTQNIIASAPVPQVPTAQSKQDPTKASPPLSLTDLQNPQTFNLGSSTPPSKRKITKADFDQQVGTLGKGLKSEGGSDDPLSSLDPLWSINK